MMWYLIAGILITSMCMHAMDTIIPGAAYFVIHTVDKSTLYRTHGVTIHGAPDFYTIRFAGLKTKITCQTILHEFSALVTFHGKDTEFLSVRRDNTPFEKLDIWRSMLDPAAKVYAYRACMYPYLKKVDLFDKRDHHIIEIPLERQEDTLSDVEDLVYHYADPSKLKNVERNEQRPPIIEQEMIIESYRVTQ